MLKEIQSLEDQLIYSSNCGSSSLLFTEMMHRTSDFRNKLTETHKHILQAARKQRKINKLKNK